MKEMINRKKDKQKERNSGVKKGMYKLKVQNERRNANRIQH